MGRIVLSSYKKFEREKKLVIKSLNKLGRLIDLKNKHLEVYLVKGGFNVHSFPAPKDFPRPDLKGCQNLGEIYLCPDYVKWEVTNGKWDTKDYKSVFNLLLIHGLLHLLGYNHKKESDRIKMERKEKEFLSKIQ